MNKKLIRLTEGDLHRIVKESVNRVLKETLGMSQCQDDGIAKYYRKALADTAQKQHPQTNDHSERDKWIQNPDEAERTRFIRKIHNGF